MSKYSEFRTNGPTTIEHHPALRPDYDCLFEDQDRHFELVKAICGTTGPDSSTPLFQCDFVLLSVLNRSLDLVDGFLWSFNRWNLSTAAPIVRMQVDNLLRLVLLSKAGPGPAVEALLSGGPLSKERDPLAPSGKKNTLTDQRLREHARDRFPWLDLVYEKSSGWIHFSSVHVGVTMVITEDGQFSGRFPSDISRYPYEFLEQVLWAMRASTAGVLDIVTEFAEGKRQSLLGWERPD
jgi:hypothetical protein